MLCTDYPICALVNVDGEENFHSYTIDGKLKLIGDTYEDLYFAPEKKEGWINIYNDYVSHSTSTVYQTKEDAEKRGKDSKYYVTTIKIEWEE